MQNIYLKEWITRLTDPFNCSNYSNDNDKSVDKEEENMNHKIIKIKNKTLLKQFYVILSLICNSF